MQVPRSRSAADSAPNVAPLLDMMFILIIFFLATSRFQAEERDEEIQLVRSRATLPISTPNDLLVINIDREGRKIVDGRERSLEEVEAIVRERLALRADTEIVVRADKRGVVAHLEETVEICTRLGKTPKLSFEASGP